MQQDSEYWKVITGLKPACCFFLKPDLLCCNPCCHLALQEIQIGVTSMRQSLVLSESRWLQRNERREAGKFACQYCKTVDIWRFMFLSSNDLLGNVVHLLLSFFNHCFCMCIFISMLMFPWTWQFFAVFLVVSFDVNQWMLDESKGVYS